MGVFLFAGITIKDGKNIFDNLVERGYGAHEFSIVLKNGKYEKNNKDIIIATGDSVEIKIDAAKIID